MCVGQTSSSMSRTSTSPRPSAIRSASTRRRSFEVARFCVTDAVHVFGLHGAALFSTGDRREVQIEDIGPKIFTNNDVAVACEIVEEGLPDLFVGFDADQLRPVTLD